MNYECSNRNGILYATDKKKLVINLSKAASQHWDFNTEGSDNDSQHWESFAEHSIIDSENSDIAVE